MAENMGETPVSNPTTMTPQQLILGEVDSLISFWPEVRNDKSLGTGEALGVLATWAHLRRFAPGTLDPSLAARLDQLVRSDSLQIVHRFLDGEFPSGWARELEGRDATWEDAVEDEAVDFLEHMTREDFDLLDRFDLALYAIRQLVATEIVADASFQRMEARVRQAIGHFEHHAELFLAATSYAMAMLAAYREDLGEFDESLWVTTLKHRRLEEIAEQRNSPEQPPHFTLEQQKEILDLTREQYVRIAVYPPASHESAEAHYSLSAKKSEPSSVDGWRLPLADGSGTLRVFPHPKRGLLTLHADCACGAAVRGIELNDSPLDLVQPFESNYAVVTTQSFEPALKGKARVSLICQVEGTRE